MRQRINTHQPVKVVTMMNMVIKTLERTVDKKMAPDGKCIRTVTRKEEDVKYPKQKICV